MFLRNTRISPEFPRRKIILVVSTTQEENDISTLCAGFFRVTRRASVGADFYIGATLGTILMIGDGIRAHFLLLQEIY